MAIITISRGSYSRGKEVAEKVAQKLGYECYAREVILEASKEFNLPELRLVKGIHDAPAVLDSFSHGRERFIAYFQSALLRRLRQDNVVYHGLAGHVYVRGIPHVLKVRIIADMDDRVQTVMRLEDISREGAVELIEKDDLERRKWSQQLYGIDTADPGLYDLVIRVRKMSVDDAVNVICNTVGMDIFKTTPESRKGMEDLVLASDVKTALLELKPDIQVLVLNGAVTIGASDTIVKNSDLVKEIEKVVRAVPGVKQVSIKSTQLVELSD